MFLKNKPPKTKNVQAVKPYYLEYNGETGYAQVVGRIEKEFVAIIVNNCGGKVNRIMKVTKHEFFSDFGGTCTQLDIRATKFVLNS